MRARRRANAGVEKGPAQESPRQIQRDRRPRGWSARGRLTVHEFSIGLPRGVFARDARGRDYPREIMQLAYGPVIQTLPRGMPEPMMPVYHMAG